MTKCKHITELILYLIIAAEFAYKDNKHMGVIKLGKARMKHVLDKLWEWMGEHGVAVSNDFWTVIMGVT